VTYPKIKPCPRCGCGLTVYRYDSGWKFVECDNCFYFGPGEGTITQAIRSHNEAVSKHSERRSNPND
jgi:hypothetical protein